jgi:uncharacterized protein (DUF39 family)
VAVLGTVEDSVMAQVTELAVDLEVEVEVMVSSAFITNLNSSEPSHTVAEVALDSVPV